MDCYGYALVLLLKGFCDGPVWKQTQYLIAVEAGEMAFVVDMFFVLDIWIGGELMLARRRCWFMLSLYQEEGGFIVSMCCFHKGSAKRLGYSYVFCC